MQRRAASTLHRAFVWGVSASVPSAHGTCSLRAGVFAYAGTKDKRAVTVQQVTAFKVADSRLAALNSRLWYAATHCPERRQDPSEAALLPL